MIFFSFPSFLFSIWFCSPSKKRPLGNCFLLLCPEHKDTGRYLSLEGVILKNINLPFGSVSISVIPSRPRWSKTSNPFVWLSPGEKKMVPNQLFLIWCIWSRLIWVSVKILTSLFRFLQNWSARFCFKGSLMPPKLSYIML